MGRAKICQIRNKLTARILTGWLVGSKGLMLQSMQPMHRYELLGLEASDGCRCGRLCMSLRTCNVSVLLQRAELVHSREHVDEFVQPFGKQLKPQEHRPLIHLKRLGRTVAATWWHRVVSSLCM